MSPANRHTEGWRPGEIVLGQYEALDELHYGGFGVVQRVRHREWDAELAVKTPRLDRMSDRELSDFVTEAEVWVGLDPHPHVVNCVYVRRVDGLPRVFAEWVAGGSLAEAVRGGRLYDGGPRAALARILDVAVQMAWGIGHAHANGLVHQDVKPGNVMLDPDGTAKVTDFGLARARAGTGAVVGESAQETLLASFGGLTVPYCSPEQARRGGVRLTRATDVWSWAVSVLELFVGGLPVRDGRAAAHRLEALVAEPAGAPVPQLPREVAAVLRGCFAPEAADRPGMDEVADRLVELYPELTGTRYPRAEPAAVKSLADGLSNRALSLLDLGRVEEAQRAWAEAIAVDPHHAAAVYNVGLHLWRTGERTDEDAVSALTAVCDAHPGDWLPRYLLGLVHLERDDVRRAREAFGAAAGVEPSAREVAAALRECQRLGQRPDIVSMTGHTGRVTATAVSGRGEVAASADEHGLVCLWETSTADVLYRVKRRGGGVTALAVGDDGDAVLIGYGDGHCELWRPGRSKRPRRFTAPAGDSAVGAVALSGDGRRAATGHADGAVRVWDVGTGGLVREVNAGMERRGPRSAGRRVDELALSWNGTLVVASTPGIGGRVRAWRAETGELESELTGAPGPGSDHLNRIAVAPDASKAVVVPFHGPAVVWDAVSGRSGTIGGLLRRADVTGLAYSAEVELAVSTYVGPLLRFWDTSSTGCRLSLSEADLGDYGIGYRSPVLSRDGSVVLLSHDHPSRVRVIAAPRLVDRVPWYYVRPRPVAALADTASAFDAAMGRAAVHLEAGANPAAIEELRAARRLPGFARHPQLLRQWRSAGRSARRRGVLGVWPLLSVDDNGAFTELETAAVSATGDFAVAATESGHLEIWDLDGGRRRCRFPGSASRATELTVSSDDRFTVSVSGREAPRVWDNETGDCLYWLKTRGATVGAAAVSANGARVLTGDDTGRLRVWDTATGTCQRTVGGGGGPARSVALDPGGRYAAVVEHREPPHTGAAEGVARVWDLGTGECVLTVGCRTAQPGIGFSPDGRRLFLVHLLRVTAWDLDTGEPRYSLEGGTTSGNAFALGADGGLGVVARYENGLRVWDQATGEVLWELPDGSQITSAVTVTPDSRFAIAGGWDRIVRIWDLRSGECVRTLEGHRAEITAVRLSGDGNRLVTMDRDNGMRAWDLEWDYDTAPREGE